MESQRASDTENILMPWHHHGVHDSWTYLYTTHLAVEKRGRVAATLWPIDREEYSSLAHLIWWFLAKQSCNFNMPQSLKILYKNKFHCFLNIINCLHRLDNVAWELAAFDVFNLCSNWPIEVITKWHQIYIVARPSRLNYETWYCKENGDCKCTCFMGEL